MKQKWVEVAEQVLPDPTLNDAKAERKAADIIEFEKKKELRNSAKARDWEAGRKKEWQLNKKAAMLARNPKPQDPARALIEQYKRGGEYDCYALPTRGYVIVTVDEPIKETKSGVLFFSKEEDAPNTGTVNAIGDTIVYGNKDRLEPPATVGDRILFRRNAGMDITLKGRPYLVLHFQDVILVFEEPQKPV